MSRWYCWNRSAKTRILKSCLPARKASACRICADRRARRMNGDEKPVWADANGDSITVHGFRSTFCMWAAETTSYSREVAEHALVVRNDVEALPECLLDAVFVVFDARHARVLVFFSVLRCSLRRPDRRSLRNRSAPPSSYHRRSQPLCVSAPAAALVLPRG